MIPPFTKRVVAINVAVPLALLAWDACRGDLGANPVNFAIRTTGILALICLVATMAVTPVVAITGWHGLATFRRTLGVYAFVYAATHFGLFFAFDRGGNVFDTVSEIGQRAYLFIGAISLGIMTPLAVTSTNGMIRRFGPRRWKWLHRLAYVAAALAVLHFYMLVKADTTRPIVFGGLLGLAFAWRLGHHYWTLRAAANRPAPVAGKPTFWTGPLTVARIFEETPDVKTFRLVNPAGGELPFAHKPGQYLNVTLPIDGQTVRRSYTIASPPSRAVYCEITVKREANGLASRYLHDVVREGMSLAVAAPAGRFTFTGAEAGRIVLIGGGVGITPLMAKIRELTDRGWPGSVRLIYSVRTPADLIFREELRFLNTRYPNLEITLTCTRGADETWSGERGRIDAALLRRLIPDWAGTRIHLCGPTEMTAPLIETLKGFGIPAAQIKDEAFASPSRVTSSPGIASRPLAEPFDGEVRFAKSGRTVADSKGRVLLDIAEGAGVTIPFDCRSGICGRCKTKVLDGDVVMDADDALTARDREAGLVLACQARCRGDVTVEA
jgi:ferredoxin-NADP reductase/DMSO/TMAO reductase YedYZ heme-binding membrane subunit